MLCAYVQENKGKRRFVVTTIEQMYYKLEVMMTSHRHFYEVIRDNAPCRLYFDLEYSTAHNPGTDGIRALSTFLKLLCVAVRDTFNIDVR